MMTARFLLPLAALFAAPAAFATEAPATMKVSAAGLDLASPVGRAALEGRVAVAARQVCDIGDERMLPIMLAERSCVLSAVDGAARDFAALNRARTVQLALARPVPVTGAR